LYVCIYIKITYFSFKDLEVIIPIQNNRGVDGGFTLFCLFVCLFFEIFSTFEFFSKIENEKKLFLKKIVIVPFTVSYLILNIKENFSVFIVCSPITLSFRYFAVAKI